MPFKSISRHQPSQREPKLSWPSLTGKSLRDCRYLQNKTPQRSLLPKQQQSSNPRQQKAPKPLDVAGTGSYFRPCQWSLIMQCLQPAVYIVGTLLKLGFLNRCYQCNQSETQEHVPCLLDRSRSANCPSIPLN